MNANDYINLGNEFRSNDQYNDALASYAQAFLLEPENKHAWNNYGNVLREIGEPKRARPFLEHAIALDPSFVTANFNLSISSLLAGDYELGWRNYEWRWQYEHLAGTLPVLPTPRWTGESLQGKNILVIGEQGFGDIIQFSRFLLDLKLQGASIQLLVLPGLVPLFQQSVVLDKVHWDFNEFADYDYWSPIMSLPGILGVTLDKLKHQQGYLAANPESINQWREILGIKSKMRVGITWSGRPDSWANRYKQLPINFVLDLVNSRPDIEWISMQADCSEDISKIIDAANVRTFPGSIQHWGDTAGLISNLDLMISVDTSVAHMAGALGIPTWIPLTKFAVDWRWGVNTELSPWYPSARLFRQPD